MLQKYWLKKLKLFAPVTLLVRIQSLEAQWVKDLALSPLWLSMLLWSSFDLQPWNFCVSRAQPKKEKRIQSVNLSTRPDGLGIIPFNQIGAEDVVTVTSRVSALCREDRAEG